MKFERLVLEKYGIYEGRTLSFRPDAHLHIVVGRNEAGKTSALSAMSDLLFNFPNVSPYAVGYSPNTMRLGARLLLDSGEIISFRRRKGRTNTIVDDNDMPLGDDLMQQVLGSIDRATFESEFGLTAERLRAGGRELLAAGGKLAETLAAGSSGLSALNALKARLQGEADDLFTARKVGSKAFYMAADAYADKSRELREAIVTVDAVGNAEATCSQVVDQQKVLTQEHQAASRLLQRLQRAQNTRTKLRELEETERELAGLPAPPEAAAGQFSRWRDALVAEENARQQMDALREAVAFNAQEVKSLDQQPALLACAQEIAQLQRTSGAAEDYHKDMPRREREHHAARSNLERAASRLGLSSTDALIAGMPTRPVLAGIREAVQQRRERERQRREKQESLEKASRRRDDLEKAASARGHAADPADLKRAFESFDHVPADAADLRRRTAVIRQDLRDIENRLARLSPAPPPLRDLIGTALPDISRVEEARRKLESLASELETTDRQMGDATGEIDAAERELDSLERIRPVATRDDLTAARQMRDEATRALQTAAPDVGGAALAALVSANENLDRITDELLGNADEAARKLALEQELLRLRASAKRMRESKTRLAYAQSAELASWRALWRPLEIEPEAPAVMAAWLNEAVRAVADYDALSAGKAEMEALRDKLQAQEEPLNALLKKLGVEPLDRAPVDKLYEAARVAIEDAESRWTERRLQAQSLENAIRDVEAIESEIAELQTGDQAQEIDWRGVMTILQCQPSAGVAEAVEALTIWDEALLAHDKVKDEEARLSGMRTRIGDFEKAVKDLCARVAPELAQGDAFVAVEQLSVRLQNARDAERDLQRLGAEGARFEQQLAKLETDFAAAQVLVSEGASRLGLPDAAALAPALERLTRRETLLGEAASTRRDLAAMTNGMSAEELRAEAEGLDFDTLEGEIARLQDRLDQIREEEKAAFAASREAGQALEALRKGRNAAALAQQKQEAAAELLDISRRWLVRAAAARLAAQAIERHRQSAQDPVIARTSALFSHATGGAFEALGMLYGDKDELVFRAVRAGGKDVAVDGLSDGTRDQLFLALRLALLEQRRGEPLPFIGDDILTSFDEERTAQAIGMLAEFGEQRQTIIFSHHRHVAEIAAEKLGERLDLIEL